MANEVTKPATPLPPASPDSVGFSGDRLHRLDGAIEALIDAGNYAGISVTIARHGKLVKSAHYGFQSLDSKVLVDQPHLELPGVLGGL